MRQLRSILLIGVTLIVSLFAACGSTTNQVAAGCTPKADTSNLNLVQNKQLTVASDATYPPQEYVDSTSHKIVGMEIDLATQFAKDLCLTPNIQNVQFNTIIAGITASTPGNQYYDMSISAFTITSDRQKQVDMIPYFKSGSSLLVPKGNPKNIQKLSDLCGMSVAVENGTIEHDEIAGSTDGTTVGINQAGQACASNNIKLLSYDTQDQVIQQLDNGSVDATFQDSPVSGYYAKLNATKVQIGPIVDALTPEGIVVRKDNAPFETAIKTVLASMQADGTYTQILTKWGLTDGACATATCS